MKRLLIIIVFSSLFIAACQTAPIKKETSAEQKVPAAEKKVTGKNGVQELIANMKKREVAESEEIEISPADGGFTAKFESALKPKIMKFEKAWAVNFKFDEANAACIVSSSKIELVNSLKSTSEHFLSLLNAKKKSILKIDSGLIGTKPYIYLVQNFLNGEKAYGEVKVYGVNLSYSSILCNVTDLGYEKSLERVVKKLATTIRLKNKLKSDYKTREIALYKLNDMNVGFIETFTFEDDGKTTYISESNYIMPRVDSYVASYSADLEVTNAKGIFQQGKYYSEENGELELALTLEKKGDRNYFVSGTFQGKQIAKEMALDYDLYGDVYVSNLLKKHFEEDKKKTPFKIKLK